MAKHRLRARVNALAVNSTVLYVANGTLSSFQAIKHLHDNQLVHLDIKPENIFVMREGYCKLGDFGLVMDLSGSVRHASAGLCRVIEQLGRTATHGLRAVDYGPGHIVWIIGWHSLDGEWRKKLSIFRYLH